MSLMRPVQVINSLADRYSITSPYAAAILRLCTINVRINLAATGFLDSIHLKQTNILEILALKPNGALECRWLKYKIVGGSMRKEAKDNIQNLENNA